MMMGTRALRVAYSVRRPAAALLESPASSTNSKRFSSGISSGQKALRLHSYAAVHHGEAYQAAIEGRHGQQLSLAYKEGVGKDDPPYDPFDDSHDNEEEYEEEDVEGEEDDEGEEDEEGEEDDDSLMEGGDDQVPQIMYNNDGSLIRPKSELSALRAGLPSGGLFAIVSLHNFSFQQKVCIHDLLIVNKLRPVTNWSIGSVHTLRDVLLMGCSHLTLVGMPFVMGGEVDVMVEEITRDEKVVIFKKRRRKNSRRKNAFRREVTLLRVLDIRLPERFRNTDYTGKSHGENTVPDEEAEREIKIGKSYE